jgi:hypothetical protein
VSPVRKSTIRKLSAGQIDSALSSIATFVAGLYAVRVFDTRLLGAYVVIFTAWNLARSLSSELVFVPSEVVAVARPEKERIHILDSSLPRGFAISLLGAGGVLGSMYIIRGDVGTEAALALAASAAAVTVLAPLQEHWRRMFHIAGSSWRAAATSTVHLAITLVGVFTMGAFFDAAWIPFGVLAAGFTVSSLLAWSLTLPLRASRNVDFRHPRWQELTGIGRWLLVANASAMGSDFILAVTVKAAIGPEMLGFAEGARVVARPVVILGVGLAAVLGPRSVRAGMDRDLAHARWSRRVFWLVSSVAALLYLGVVGFDWALNPLPELVPTAYAVPGLVAVAIVGSVIFNFALPWWFEILGGRQQRTIAWSEAAGSLVKVAVGFLSTFLQAFTLPIAWGAAWLTRGYGLQRSSRRMFLTEPGSAEAAAPVPSVYD